MATTLTQLISPEGSFVFSVFCVHCYLIMSICSSFQTRFRCVLLRCLRSTLLLLPPFRRHLLKHRRLHQVASPGYHTLFPSYFMFLVLSVPICVYLQFHGIFTASGQEYWIISRCDCLHQPFSLQVTKMGQCLPLANHFCGRGNSCQCL